MPPSDLHARLRSLVGFTEIEAPEPVVHAERRRTGYTERGVSYLGCESTVHALLLAPDAPTGGAVLLHHQHNAEWHLGKSEPAGVLGDRWQAFGPALAERGVTVLVPDAVGFEDRRSSGPGTDPRSTDSDEYWAHASYRLLTGRLLMSTVLADAAAGHALLAALPDVDADRVGGLGHSMGGATALWHAALDPRVAFAASSGAACTLVQRMRDGTGIEAAQVIPGLLELGDMHDIAALIAPRPLLVVSATEDKYSRDAPRIAEVAGAAYRKMGADGALRHERFAGGHALTAERFAVIVDWVASRATGG